MKQGRKRNRWAFIASTLAIILTYGLLSKCTPDVYGAEFRGQPTDIFTHSRAQRPDLYSHAAVTGSCTLVAGYGLETFSAPYADEAAALGCFLAVSSKEWQDQWKDRGDMGANAVGALIGYGLKKVLPPTPVKIGVEGDKLMFRYNW